MNQASSFKKYAWTTLFLLLCAPAVLAAEAPASRQTPGMIEVGFGASAASHGTSPIEAVFEVRFESGGVALRENTYFVLARISSGMMLGSNGISFIDMQFDTLNLQLGRDGSYIGISAVGTDIQRDFLAGNSLTARVSFLGLRGAYEAGLSEDIDAYVRGAVDLIGTGMVTTGNLYVGSGMDVGDAELLGGAGISGEIGVRFHKRVRIALGEKVSSAMTYIDEYGRIMPIGTTSQTYATLAVDLTQSLRLFGKVSYNVYELVPTIEGDAFRLMFGVSQTF